MGPHGLLRPPTGHTPPPKSYVGQTEVGHAGTRAKPDLNGAEAPGPKIPRVFAPSLASTKLGKRGKMRAGGDEKDLSKTKNMSRSGVKFRTKQMITPSG